MTRMPDSCSRSTWLTRSILTCMTRKSGIARDISSPMTTAISGTMTSSRADSGTSCRRAITIPPTHMIGAVSITVSPISTSICICCTSLVLRVISDGVPNSLTSRAEKVCTVLNSDERTSRPNPIETRALQ